MLHKYCGPPTGKRKNWYEPRPATEVIQVDLNYGNTASPWGEPEQVGACIKGNAQVWVTTHADNAATCPAGAVTTATQSLASSTLTCSLSEQGNPCCISMVQFVAHAWPLPEAKSTTMLFAPLSHRCQLDL